MGPLMEMLQSAQVPSTVLILSFSAVLRKISIFPGKCGHGQPFLLKLVTVVGIGMIYIAVVDDNQEV
jgi:hypothetical protein